MKLKRNSIKLTDKPIYFAILNIILLSYAHMTSNRLISIVSLVFFCGLVLISDKKFFLPLMLFYLPWNPILKIQSNGFTFFTLIVPIILLDLILRFKKINVITIIITILISILTMISKIFNGYNINFSYLYIMLMFLFIPYYYTNYKKEISFKTCIYYLVFGIITACLSEQILMNIPHMLDYIIIDKVEQTGLTRLNGFYGDANFYSSQILVAISGLLTLILYSKKNINYNLILVTILLFFGLQSVSKMFLLSVIVIFFIWIFLIITENKSIKTKVNIIFLIGIVLSVCLIGNVFKNQISQYIIRFDSVTDMRTFTTGRSSILESYIEYFKKNPIVTLFGIGISPGYVNKRASHNTIVQMIFQLGIIGSSVIFIWIKLTFTDASKKLLNKYSIILFIGIFIPWMSLDMLMFDEFFYFILLFYIGKNYLTDNKKNLNELDRYEERKYYDKKIISKN